MISFSGVYHWFGDQFLKHIEWRYDNKMEGVARSMVRVAQAHAPVDTGLLKSKISYNYRKYKHELVLISATSYGMFQEFGTVHFPAHPYIRPALEHGATLLGGTKANLGMFFNKSTRLKGEVAKPTKGQHFWNQARNRVTSQRFNRGIAGNARHYIRTYKGGPRS